MTVETALGAEMEAHLGYSPHEAKGRNGHSTKRLKGDHGEVEITTPRDRNGSFAPQIVRKGQTRLTLHQEEAERLLAEPPKHLKAMARFTLATGLSLSKPLILWWAVQGSNLRPPD